MQVQSVVALHFFLHFGASLLANLWRLWHRAPSWVWVNKIAKKMPTFAVDHWPEILQKLRPKQVYATCAKRWHVEIRWNKLLLSWLRKNAVKYMVLQQERKAIFQTYYAESSALERTLKTTLKAHCWIHTRTLRRIWRKAVCELFVKAVLLVCVVCVCVFCSPVRASLPRSSMKRMFTLLTLPV